MIDGKTFFDQSVKNNKVTYENIIKIATVKGQELYNWLFVRLYLL